VYKALVDMEHHSSIAKEHRVSPSIVSRLVCKAKGKKEFYSELMLCHREKEEKYSQIKEAILSRGGRKTFIDSVASLHQDLVHQDQIEVKPKEVHHVLKK